MFCQTIRFPLPTADYFCQGSCGSLPGDYFPSLCLNDNFLKCEKRRSGGGKITYIRKEKLAGLPLRTGLDLSHPIAQNHSVVRFIILMLVLAIALPVVADEGLWPYNQFPRAAIKQKYGFDVSDAFLDHLRLSTVRISPDSGEIGDESGSFVSSGGLLVTSRSAAAGCLAKAGVQGPDLVQDGFSAAVPADELPCPGLSASVLVKVEDVSGQLKTAGQSLAQRNAAIARIEKDCAATTHNICSVTRLFAGGRYDLYRYQRYTDLRLVFAPEYSAAFFGKEHDSISYLRYGLNIAFLRSWQNGKPAVTPNFLKWSSDDVRQGDLVFAAGNPGPTSRVATAAQLTFVRDSALPLTVARLQTRILQLNAFANLSEANARAAQPVLTPLLKTFKTEAGKLIGLRDDRLVTRKTVFEQKIRRAVENDPRLGLSATKVWDEVAGAYKKWTPFEKPYQLLEGAPAPGSRLFRMARQIVRGEAVTDSETVNDQIETLLLTLYLEELKTLGEKGDKEVPVKAILAGRTPRQAAEAMVQSTGLKDAAQRRHVAASQQDDGLIHLAALLDAPALRLRKQHDETLGSLEVAATEKIAQYRFKIFGDADYPDGTGTPRIEFGIVSGYTDRAAVAQPFASTFSGLYYRKNNDGPWQVAKKWLDARTGLHEVTPLDFVSTCDIGGGDYGSPVVNRAGELVGVTFDGNLESLPNVYLYTSEQARAVHVDATGIAEALDKVYKAGALLQELGLRNQVSRN
jgi:hypothetical protein